ncbi:MAG: phosphoadenylyl-sulfate reductase [Victivallaceae bacterium]|nr:phosphoadenylyl-sulfate reductase [Victivallaceae bacterium]
MKEQVLAIKEQLSGKTAEEILQWIAFEMNGQVVFATGMGAEDQVIIDMIWRHKLAIPSITLDTGRLFNETHELIQATEERYNAAIKVFYPNSTALEAMVAAHGINLFRNNVEQRKMCCQVRKIDPLKRALAPYSAWICGLRRSQSVTRSDIEVVAWDEANQMIKINPLVDWNEYNVWDYIKEHDVPYSKLHDSGFPSIGCSCCTRAIGPGEDVRAGRWWWETPEQKECGLHLVNGKLTRAAK